MCVLREYHRCGIIIIIIIIIIGVVVVVVVIASWTVWFQGALPHHTHENTSGQTTTCPKPHNILEQGIFLTTRIGRSHVTADEYKDGRTQ